jgi:hypothetical protein
MAMSVLVLSQIMCSTSGDEPPIKFNTLITITTYMDANRNEVQDAGEDGLPNIPIKVEEILSLGYVNSSVNKTRENGQVTSAGNYSIAGMSPCLIVTVTITPPAGMVSTKTPNH